MSLLKNLFLLFLCLICILGCTRDDICPAETPTTPLLVITFKDFTNRALDKAVFNLEVRDATQPDIILFNVASTDSIAIPLRNFSERTELLLARNADTAVGTPNPDQFNLVYTTEDIYLNRACGFIANYNDLTGQLIDESGDNWIFSFEIVRTSVTDQNEAHLTLFH